MTFPANIRLSGNFLLAILFPPTEYQYLVLLHAPTFIYITNLPLYLFKIVKNFSSSEAGFTVLKRGEGIAASQY